MTDQRPPEAGKIRNRLLRAILSIPIYGKMLGAGVFVATLFGAVTSYQINYSASDKLYHNLEHQSLTVGLLIADYLTRPLVIDDLTTAREIMRHAMEENQSILYIEVQDPECETIMENPKPAGATLTKAPTVKSNCTDSDMSAWRHGDGIILESRTPILEGQFGTVRVGLSDTMIVTALRELNESFLWTLLICVILGQGMALVLSYYLVKPIHHLVGVSEHLSAGDLTRRATVYFDDEIGDLATAFNSMAESIEGSSSLLIEKENARAKLVKEVVRSGERERAFIARELHDELGQTLTLLLMQIQSWECSSSGGLCDNRSAYVETVQKLVNDVRQMAFVIRPTILDDYGLSSALQRYTEEVLEHTGLDVGYHHIKGTGTERLPAEVENTLYRIVQEAISNAVKHSEANNVSVVFVQNEENSTLIVEDNGVGFDLETVNLGLGIIGMRERASLANGEFIIESGVGQGTTIKINISTKEVAHANQSTHSG